MRKRYVWLVVCAMAISVLSSCATSSTFNDFCVQEKKNESNFIKHVQYPIDGMWEDVERSNNCVTVYRIDKGIIYADQNKCYPACSNNLDYVDLERIGPCQYTAKAQYRGAKGLPFYDRATTIQVIDDHTLVVISEARAGMASSRFFLKKRQLADPALFEQELSCAGGEEVKKRAIKQQKNLEQCLKGCQTSCKNQCIGPLLQSSLSPSPGNLFIGQMGSAQCQEACYRSCAEACEKNK